MEYTKNFQIADIKIGKECPCYVVAEIGINHNGDIKIAKLLIDEAKKAGANAVKFQKRHLESLYKNEVIENPNLESQGFEILLDVLKNVELSDSDYKEIIKYCDEKNITFLCTAWDIESVNFLESLNVPAYKIASADLTNFPLIKKTIEFLNSKNSNFLLLHSNSTYPAPVESLNLELIPFYQQKFQNLVGYSGHEQGIIPSVTATVLGAVLIERHITLDKTMEGIDQSSSLEPKEFAQLISFIRESEKSRGKAVKKMTRGEILQKEVLGKSIVCCSDIDEDQKFSEENIEVKGPAKGLSPQFYYDMIGKKSNRSIKKGAYLQENDL
jgi:sialic acid synthase SpsE